MILFVPSIKRGQSRRKIDVVQAGKEGMQNCIVSRTFRFLRAKQFWKWMLVMMHHTVECISSPSGVINMVKVINFVLCVFYPI